MESLHGSIEEINGCDVVRLEGEIDLANAPELRGLLEPLGSNGRSVTVDLTGVTFMDSSGLKVLLDFASHSLDGIGALGIANPPRPVLRVMNIVGMTELPQIEVKVDDGQHG